MWAGVPSNLLIARQPISREKPSLDALIGRDSSLTRFIVESLCARGVGVYRSRLAALGRMQGRGGDPRI